MLSVPLDIKGFDPTVRHCGSEPANLHQEATFSVYRLWIPLQQLLSNYTTVDPKHTQKSPMKFWLFVKHSQKSKFSSLNITSQQAFTQGIHKTNLILRARFLCVCVCPLCATTRYKTRWSAAPAKPRPSKRETKQHKIVKSQTQAKRQRQKSWDTRPETSWETKTRDERKTSPERQLRPDGRQAGRSDRQAGRQDWRQEKDKPRARPDGR